MNRCKGLNGAIVYTDDVTIYGVYRIDIDTDEKTIELWGFCNTFLGKIDYKFSSGPIEYVDYYEDNTIKPFADTIVNGNGEVVI